MNSILKELAEKLSINSVNTSLWNFIVDKKKPVYQDVFDTSCGNCNKIIELPGRYIVVVGAGASHDALKNLKLGRDAGNELINHFKRKSKIVSGLITEEIERLENVYQLNKNDFETKLLAISKFFSKEVKKKLSELYNFRYYPSLTYEIIAHLLKHRFIDAVINFNYDELLDQAIEDELQQNEYKKVISEGDFDEGLFRDDNTLKHPLYIKPHGTCNNPSSLRFTREDYFALPPGISMIIRRLLKGKTVNINNQEKETPINLIVIGFHMQSFEFNKLFVDSFTPDSKIYFINKSIPDAPVKKPGDTDGDKEKWDKFTEMFTEHNLLKVEASNRNSYKTRKDSLDGIMNELWKKIENSFNEKYKPRCISRNELISYLFKRHELKNELDYLWDRTWVELVLSVSKYKGFSTLYQLLKDRFGKYFFLLQRKQDHKKSLNKSNTKTIIDFCNELGMSSVGYSERAFILGPENNSMIIDRETFEKRIPEIFDKLYNKVSDKTRQRLKKSKKLFKSILLELFDKEDSEIYPEYGNYYFQSVFKNPKVIETGLSLKYYTRHYIKEKDWTTLLIVAETGEWFTKEIDKHHKKKVVLIIADKAKENDLKNYNNTHTHQLNWWQHNQHMTIFLKGKKPNLEPLQAIYFMKSHKGNYIDPVFLENKQDCEKLIKIFIAYCNKAKNNAEIEINNLQLNTEIGPDDVKKFYSEYF